MRNRRNLRPLPNTYNQLDLFVPEFSDIATRALQDLMWRPFFALGKKPRYEPIVYESEAARVLIAGAKPFGIATIWDADILLWITSQIVEARDKGEETSPHLYFTPYDCLKGIFRTTGGQEYRLLAKSIERLHATIIQTDIRKIDQVPLTRAEQRKVRKGFHWLESYGIEYVKVNGKEIPKGISVVIPNWLYRGIINRKNVLTIDDRYFRIRGGLERALYLIARKHVGYQTTYPLSMKILYEKTGSDSPFKEFVRMVRKIVERDRLPEYSMEIYHGSKGDEIVTFIRRSELPYEDPRHENQPLTKNEKRYIRKETLKAFGEEV